LETPTAYHYVKDSCNTNFRTWDYAE